MNGLGGKVADKIAASLGSWPFIIGQTVAIVIWMAVNVVLWNRQTAWDPYPFILLNLLFSIQAAYTGPILLISNNRQEALAQQQEELAEKQLLYILHIVEALRDHIMLARVASGGLGLGITDLAVQQTTTTVQPEGTENDRGLVDNSTAT